LKEKFTLFNLKTMKSYLLLFIVLPFLIFSQTGPGGIGSSTDNIIWLRADDGVYTDAGTTLAVDGESIQQWSDQSGNVSNASQTTATNKPILKTSIINGHSVIRFDGSNDWIGITKNFPETNYSFFIVFKTISSDGDGALATVTDPVSAAAGSHDRNFGLTADKMTHRLWSEQTITSGASFNDDAAHIAYINVKSGVGQTLYVDGTSVASGNKGASDFNWESGMVLGGHNALGYLNCDIAEIIFYNVCLNTSTQKIIENYLASKYAITIASDLFSYDGGGGFGYEVAGIGRAAAGDTQSDSQGTSIMGIKSPSSLDDGDYLFWGNNNAAPAAPNTTDVPVGVDNRLERLWRVEKTNDIGTVTITFDLASYTVGSSSDLVLLVDDDDGIFTNASTVSISSYSGTVATFNTVTLNSGAWLTIGSLVGANPLPVGLISFEGKLINEKVNLNWTTNSEINNDFYLIEKSKDGINWDYLDRIEGLGNTTSTNSFNLIDSNPFIGISYYRLSQTDYNGKSTHLRTITTINNEFKSFEISYYPNPFKDKLIIQCNKDFLNNLKIIDNSGKEILYLMDIEAINDTEHMLNLTHFPKGEYFIFTQNQSFQILKE
jgi:hypothetical protein